ncbi:MAG: hypothetical protein HFJ04_02015 [Lachnospiraceae bacterium]|nr:hypothetical protein [Lachnospiraceae bacterium]
MSERVSVKEAAELIGCEAGFVRMKMREKGTGRWDLGEVAKSKKPGGRYTYYIFRAKLNAFLGKEGTKE